MFHRILEWRQRRVLDRCAIDAGLWEQLLAELPILAGLDADAAQRLHRHASLFLHERDLVPMAGLEVDAGMRAALAAVACLPVLNIGLRAYRGGQTVLVYPGSFLANHVYTDEAGVIHEETAPLAGEAWDGGPLVFSWDDVVESLEALDGYNVVIHECCHQLDMANGDANGMPPLPAGMDPSAWSAAFSAAFDALHASLDAGETPVLDPYAAESPGEFFAVACEAFFECPRLLRETLPAVHAQLTAYFHQDPAERLPPPDP